MDTAVMIVALSVDNGNMVITAYEDYNVNREDIRRHYYEDYPDPRVHDFELCPCCTGERRPTFDEYELHVRRVPQHHPLEIARKARCTRMRVRQIEEWRKRRAN